MQTNVKHTITEKNNASLYRKAFWPMLIVFYALFAIRNVFSIQFPIVFYLVWVAVMAFNFNDTEIKALIIAFIPLAPGFQSKYAVLICMIFLLIKYGKQLRVPLYVSIVPLLMFWEYLHLNDDYSTIAEYLSGFAPLMCLAIIVSLPLKHEDTSVLSRVLAVSLAVGSLILIVNTTLTSSQSLIALIQEGFRLGSIEEAEIYQIVYNANQLGFLCNITIAGLLINIHFKKAKKGDYFLLAFAILIGCLTVSRTFLLCLVGTFLMYVLLQKKSLYRKAKTLFRITIIVFVAFILLKVVVPDIVDNYVARFSADDITGGRSYLYSFYNDFINSSPKYLWYGIGVQNISSKVGNLTGAVLLSPHNGYQQIILAWGVFGLILMMLFILCLVLQAQKRNAQISLICYLPLILLLTNIFAGQFITSGTKLLSLIYIYLMIYSGGKWRNNIWN